MLTSSITPCAISPARVVIVDDDRGEQERLAEGLAGCSDVIVSSKTNFDCIEFRLAESHSPDVVLIDISNRNQKAIATIHFLKDRFPAIRLLAMTTDGEDLHGELVQSIGTLGYIHKQASPQEILAAIRHMLNGNILLSDRMFHQLMNRMSMPANHSTRSHCGPLTERESEVFRLIGAGLTTAEIASKLALSAKTVETHRHKIKMRLNLRNSCELTREAVRWVIGNS